MEGIRGKGKGKGRKINFELGTVLDFLKEGSIY